MSGGEPASPAPEKADPAVALLCPLCALCLYMDRAQSFRTSEQLFVCYGGQQKRKALTKQRMSPCPLNLRAHSTRSVASSWALACGSSLTNICRAAGWATPNTFTRFYSVHAHMLACRSVALQPQHHYGVASVPKRHKKCFYVLLRRRGGWCCEALAVNFSLCVLCKPVLGLGVNIVPCRGFYVCNSVGLSILAHVSLSRARPASLSSKW